MNLIERFKANIKQHHLFLPKDKLLLAVSGGVDSVVLCELCKQAGFDFSIAHCNFQLRGKESSRDEEFVMELGKKYHVEVLVKRFETKTYAAEKKLSTQEAARELRYRWFTELLTSDVSRLTSPAYLLTAHHADDNAETLLMHFCRGTGLHGLTGIPAISPLEGVRRPLLPFFKKEILQFANEHKLSFVEDSSNQSSQYTRNLFRNEIIPAIAKVYPQVTENLLGNVIRFKETENLYRFLLDELKKKLCKQKGKEVHIPIKQLLAFNNRALIYDIIAEYGFTEKQVDEVIKLSGSESGHYISNASHRIIRHRHWFIIAPQQSKEAEHIIVEGIGNWQLAIGNWHIESLPAIKHSTPGFLLTTHDSRLPTPNSNQAYLDAKNIHFPLLLRKWKTGDYFYPLGMQKKKKLARFFIDQKLSKTDKEKIWVLEMNQKIIWVVNHRIDDRFKITEQTNDILLITVG